MKELYEAGHSTNQIGKQLGFSRETVRLSLISLGVEVATRGKGRHNPPRTPRINKQRKPLSDEEVRRLRREVGIIDEDSVRG